MPISKHTQIHRQMGSIITIKKKRENIPKKFFIHFRTMPSTDKSKETATQKKNFPLQTFLNKLPKATSIRSNIEHVNNNDIFIRIFSCFRHPRTIYVLSETVIQFYQNRKTKKLIRPISFFFYAVFVENYFFKFLFQFKDFSFKYVCYIQSL